MGLFKPARQNENVEKRIRATKKLTDQETHVHLAKTDANAYVRSAAVERLTGQDDLAYVAKNDEDAGVRSTAIARLTDQNALAYIAKHEKDIDVRLTAAKKLADRQLAQEVIVDYALQYAEHHPSTNAWYAMSILTAPDFTDLEVISMIAKKSKSKYIRDEIFKKQRTLERDIIRANTTECVDHEWEQCGTYDSVIASGFYTYKCLICGKEKREHAGNSPI